MDKSLYPSLADGKLIHLDASAAFPLHQTVIQAINEEMYRIPGSPDKSCYAGALVATQTVEKVRTAVAQFINAEASEIYFVASATDAVRILAQAWAPNSVIMYSAEDHSRILHEVLRYSTQTVSVNYGENGEYDLSAVSENSFDVAFISHIHHIYGSSNHVSLIKKLSSKAKLVIDASQSVSRLRIDVKEIECDSLFFSSHKIGGVAGIGVMYIAGKHQKDFDKKYIEPSTLPLILIAGLGAAIVVLNTEKLSTIEFNNAKKTSILIQRLQQIPTIRFTKGPAYPGYMCYGYGIVSFSVDGYSSQDVAMILADHNIQVRAGDHCVDPNQVEQDVVRVSLHQYTSMSDIDSLLKVLNRF